MLKRILFIGLTSSLFFLFPDVSNAQLLPRTSEPGVRVAQQIPEEKRKLIEEFLELTGGEKTFQQVSQAMLSQMEQQFTAMLGSDLVGSPQLSPQERQQVAANMNREMSRIAQKYNQLFLERIDYQKIVEEVYYPLYDKYFTNDDLRVLIDFYKSPTGRRTIEIMPQLLQESVQRTAQVIAPTVTSIIQEIITEELKRINR
ncbi:MAG: DUF2059 domain-containing protein [Limnoraphis robusta]|uniref:DUF2059 domain-containing protein n=1 Tax=Limnoraphis robusta CS-951 TaxID=1637645 RepID=A0A0F5YL63_9CYAN|nr:DUF2059 domain-containing protein [Limnoraphis robusta]KKD39639.1 hypothetical protein WN50_02335 [Limnoraphis robusta CS-951]MEA5496360.1 DUF2059 domain-containing protein [Limnoraphis robusta BA-68 BA1]MEA5538258.1 DUF2059 domain-containing protein [Limnoraphis robusta Tam1]